jgi:hypothetical protein
MAGLAPDASDTLQLPGGVSRAVSTEPEELDAAVELPPVVPGGTVEDPFGAAPQAPVDDAARDSGEAAPEESGTAVELPPVAPGGTVEDPFGAPAPVEEAVRDNREAAPEEPGTAVELPPVAPGATVEDPFLAEKKPDEAPQFQRELPKLFPVAKPAPAPAIVAKPAEEPEAEKQLAALDPSEVKPDLTVPPQVEEQALAPVDIRAIQEQLARLGCYRSTVDGDWGPGSAKALLRYFATKKEAPDNLDPNAALLAKLSSEEKVVCQRTESDKTATKPKPEKGTVKKAKPAPDVAARPKAAPKVTVKSPPKAKPGPKIAAGEKKKKITMGTGAFR